MKSATLGCPYKNEERPPTHNHVIKEKSTITTKY